jgi:hypothetical protein
MYVPSTEAHCKRIKRPFSKMTEVNGVKGSQVICAPMSGQDELELLVKVLCSRNLRRLSSKVLPPWLLASEPNPH